jgi:hypothetical protein
MSKKTNNEKTIFDEIRDAKSKAFKVLEIAKMQEALKLKDGYCYKKHDNITFKLVKL